MQKLCILGVESHRLSRFRTSEDMYRQQTSELWTKVNIKFPQVNKENKLIQLEILVHLCKGYEELQENVVTNFKYAIGIGINDNAITVYEYNPTDEFYLFKEEIINIHIEFVKKIYTSTN